MLEASAETLLTAYKNNIAAHCEDYIWRLASARVTLVPMEDEDAESRNRRTTQLVMHLLGNGGAAVPPAQVTALRAALQVPNRGVSTLTYDLKQRPWLYLRTMTLATQQLEALKRDNRELLKRVHLLSPFPLVKSFIPGHIRLSTSAMVQLLGSVRDVEVFKQRYLAEHGVALNVRSLGDVSSSFRRATGALPESLHQEAMYFTLLWETVCRFDQKKAYRALLSGTPRLKDGCTPKGGTGEASGPSDRFDTWRFDNSITTDGYTVCFSIVKEQQLRKKNRLLERRLKQRAAKADKSPEFESLNPDTSASFLHLLDMNRYKLLAVDPGLRPHPFGVGPQLRVPPPRGGGAP